MQDTLERPPSLADIPSDVTPKKLAHLVLKTPNFDAMRKWYLAVLNGRIALESPFLAFITYDDEHHRIGLANVPRLGASDPNRAGVDHVAFTYDGLGALLKTFLRLKDVGIVPEWSINHGVTTSLYYRDPDGNKVELQIDNFDTSEELQDYFENDPGFAANPLGAPFDPLEMARKYDAGGSVAELLAMPDYPPGVTPAKLIHEMGLGSEPA